MIKVASILLAFCLSVSLCSCEQHKAREIIVVLINKLKNPHSDEGRKNAYNNLHKFINSKYQDILSSELLLALNENDNITVYYFINLLKEIPDEDKKIQNTIIRLLSDKDWHKRRNAVIALGILNNKDHVELIIKLLEDENKEVRRAAIKSLGELNDPRAAINLVKFFKKNKDDDLGDICGYVLGKFKSNEVLDQIIEVVQDDNMRYNALKALKNYSDDKVADIFMKILRQGDCQNIKVSMERKIAIEFFTNKNEVASIPLLINNLDCGVIERDKAAFALQGKGQAATGFLIKALFDKQSSINKRIIIVKILRQTKDIKSIEPLITLLGDSNKEIVEESKYALEKIGEPAILPLIKTLTDKGKKDYIKDNAANALGFIGFTLTLPVIQNMISKLGPSSKYTKKVIFLSICSNHERSPEAMSKLGKLGLEIVKDNYQALMIGGIDKKYLIESLELYGNKEMANDFLNCGIKELEVAAREWATSRGYFIIMKEGRYEGPRLHF